MKRKYYWIKERDNPQTGIYYVACGNLSLIEAKRSENAIYGYNIMHRFDSEDKYDAELNRLRESGEKIN